jgi:CRP-like cAMP-binding protein
VPSAATKSNPPGREPWSILNRLYQDLTLCWDITVIAPLEKTMASSFVPSAYGAPVQDVLAQLPISTCMEYRKGQIIYGPDQPSTSIYLVTVGKVRLSQLAEDGSEILLEIIVPDELFGESAFVNGARRAEQAAAVENAKLMIWPISAMEDLMTKRPGLAVSLLQISAQRTLDFAHRIESLSIDKAHRHHARNRYAPYEPVSEARLPALFPSGDRPLPRCLGCLERQYGSFYRRLFVIVKW